MTPTSRAATINPVTAAYENNDSRGLDKIPPPNAKETDAIKKQRMAFKSFIRHLPFDLIDGALALNDNQVLHPISIALVIDSAWFSARTVLLPQNPGLLCRVSYYGQVRDALPELLCTCICNLGNGGHRAAIIYSLVASCKLCGIDPFAYFRDVLERISTHPASRIAELLPRNWKPSRL